MTAASANRVLLSYIAETTYGTTPSGNLTEIRMTGESLKGDTTTTESGEIRDDRMISDVLRTMISASGDINFELSYGSFDDFFEAALRSSGWTAGAQIENGTTTITFAANTITLGMGVWENNPSAGSWIEVRGATDNPGANGYYKVSASTSTVITVEQTISDTGAESGTVTIDSGDMIVNGITDSSFSIERKYGDLSNIFETFVGMEIETFNLSMTAEGLITGSFGFMGKQAANATATIGTGYAAANTNPIYNTTDDVNAIQEGSADLGATAFSFSLANNLRGRTQIGSLGYQSVGDGRCSITGTLQKYFENSTQMTKYLNFTESSVAAIAEDSAGNAYVFDILNLLYTSGQRVAGGNDSDIIEDLAWTAKRDGTEDAMIRIVRFDA